MRPDRPHVLVARAPAAEVRSIAAAFGDAVLAGARGLAGRTPAGGLVFRSSAVEELHQALRVALTEVLAPSRAEIEERSQAPLDRFLDRVLQAWLCAEPGLTELLRHDPRGGPAFVFDLLRSELLGIGLELDVEPRPVGTRIEHGVRPGRSLLALAGGAFLGASNGWILALMGHPRAALAVSILGTSIGALAALRLARMTPGATCSECAAELSVDSESCPRCKTGFAREERAL